jgi:hypothetical protein
VASRPAAGRPEKGNDDSNETELARVLDDLVIRA